MKKKMRKRSKEGEWKINPSTLKSCIRPCLHSRYSSGTKKKRNKKLYLIELAASAML
jgi:hypothetical protein